MNRGDNMTPGSVPPRPGAGKSQAHPGVHPLSALTVTQQFQPLPTPLGAPPYHYDLETAVPGIGAAATKQKKLIFHCVGDTGGIKNPDHQSAVAAAMVQDLALASAKRPAFFYHIGDVVYFNGQTE